MMKGSLVVVDMQKGAPLGRYHGNYLNRKWWGKYDLVTGNIITLSEIAEETVFVTDMRFKNLEHVEIIDALRPLSEKSRQYFKTQCDGSDALASQLHPKQDVVVVGMNTDACVMRTARGLMRRGFQVTVAGDACWTAYAAKSVHPHHHALHRVRKMGIEVMNTSDLR